LKMELIQCSETAAISTETPGKHPKEIIFHLTHGESLKSRNTSLVHYKVSCSSCYSSTHLKCDDNTEQSSTSLRYDNTKTLHNMFLLHGRVRDHEHAKRPQYTVALHISPCPSEQAVRPGCSAVSFLSPAPLQCLQTAQTAKSDCLVAWQNYLTLHQVRWHLYLTQNLMYGLTRSPRWAAVVPSLGSEEAPVRSQNQSLPLMSNHLLPPVRNIQDTATQMFYKATRWKK
jgi:hypothetical protein